ncbi:hypothetical protein BSF38_05060 [Paludisphaera borealis]|uniref:Uncharacterized protein n=2 Tax=Paludisphaera borealis TaxID=1387353 RepID=A0A1U7CX73_9BACT|nr:hypothetical protein BSF38_05060 [Paludisphaera borealis]
MNLLDFFRKGRSWRYIPLGGDVDRAVMSVALLVDDEAAFRAKAREVAERLGSSAIPKLRWRFHRSTAAPPGFTIRERGLTAWMSYWQFAIFEIVYNFREQALPMLRKVAFGEYDWTQGNAIEVMCRLAAEGIDRDRTLADLKKKMPGMRDEALGYAAAPLLQLAKYDLRLAAVVDELRQVDEFENAVRDIIATDQP